MSILYNIIQRGEPGVAGGGTKKYYASAQVRETVDFEELIEEIAQLSTVNGADVSAVLRGMLEVIPKLLSRGHSIQVGNFGYFRISLSSEGSETEEEVSPTNIRRRKVIFTPGKKLKYMLNNLEFSKNDK